MDTQYKGFTVILRNQAHSSHFVKLKAATKQSGGNELIPQNFSGR